MTAALILFSVLVPPKGWFAPDAPWMVQIKPPAGTTVTLVLTDFSGSSLAASPQARTEFDKEGAADLKELFPAVNGAGTYILYAVPKGERGVANFVGTPLVITALEDRRRGAPAGPMVVSAQALAYAVISTSAGDMTAAFYYNAAPNTVRNFIRLAREGFYEGLTFHRIEPDFVVQGGDPRGDGTGGPGYNIDAEFSDRKHEEGVISMARNVDPNESPNNPPRPEYANSAGSQFFIALNYKNTAALDGAYTAFARVVGPASLQALHALATTPVADARTGRPKTAPVIRRVEIRPVTSQENPYRVLWAAAASGAGAPEAPAPRNGAAPGDKPPTPGDKPEPEKSPMPQLPQKLTPDAK